MADEMLANRYGRTPRNAKRDRWTLIIVAIGFVAVFAAWVVWAGLDGSRPTLEAKDTGYTLHNDERYVEVEFNLSVPIGRTSACAVQALNEGFVVVGWKIVEYPASDRYTRPLVEDVRVSQEANTGLIYECWLT